MSNYFQALNQNGEVLIDDTTPRLALRRIVTLSSQYEAMEYEHTLDSINSKYKFYVVPKQTGEVVCFAHSDNNVQPITCFNTSDGHCVAIFYKDSPVPSDVKLYIFGVPAQVDNGQGLLIYDANGAIIFSSEQQILYKIKSLYTYRTTWEKADQQPTTDIDTNIDGYNTAFNASVYLGQGIGPLHSYSKYAWTTIYPILFSGTLKLKYVTIYSGYNKSYGAATWDWSRCGPVGVGCTMITIDTSRYPISL